MSASITGVTPPGAPLSTATAITITGAGLTGATGVQIQGVQNAGVIVNATAVVVVDDNTITCTVTTGSSQQFDVIVQHPAGNATLPAGFSAARLNAPSPSTGIALYRRDPMYQPYNFTAISSAGGQKLYLDGSFLETVYEVRVNDVPCTNLKRVGLYGASGVTRVTCTLPVLATGVATVLVRSWYGDYTQTTTLMVGDPPAVTFLSGFYSTSGYCQIVVTGSGFSVTSGNWYRLQVGKYWGSGGSVGIACVPYTGTFPGAAPTATSVRALLKACVAPGSYNVSMVNDYGQAFRQVGIQIGGYPSYHGGLYLSGERAEHPYAPLPGQVEQAGLGVADGIADYCAALSNPDANLYVWKFRQWVPATSTTPAHWVPRYDNLYDGDRYATPSTQFLWNQVPDPPTDPGFYNDTPTISEVSEASGPTAGGNVVRIDGSGFIGGLVAAVRFGGVSARILRIVDDFTMLVQAPAHNPGLVDVDLLYLTGPNDASSATATLVQGYEYTGPILPAHPRFRITPKSGPSKGGTGCTLTAIEDGIFYQPMVVSFDSTGTPVVVPATVIDGSTAECTSPSHAIGVVDVDVTCG